MCVFAVLVLPEFTVKDVEGTLFSAVKGGDSKKKKVKLLE